MFQILIIEDDKYAAHKMNILLTQYGYSVLHAYSGFEALEVMEHHHIDLIVLDILIPKMDGYTLTKYLRSCGDLTPILIVTSLALPEKMYQGFLSGADDYMVKPVREKEFLLRIKALLRRSHCIYERRIHIGQMTLNYDSFSVHQNNTIQTLPQKEFMLLYKLLSNPNQIFTRSQLMNEIWGMDYSSSDNTLNVHITRLRKRFKYCNDFSIVSIRGVGYKAVINHGT